MERIPHRGRPPARPRIVALVPDPARWRRLMPLLEAQDRELVRIDEASKLGRYLERYPTDLVVVDWEPGGEPALALLRDEAAARFRVPVLVVGAPEGEPEGEPEREEVRRRVLDAGAADLVTAAELRPPTLGRALRLLTESGRLHREADLFRALVERSRDLVAILRPDGTLAYVSPSLGEVLGFPHDEKMGTNILEEVHPEDRSAVEEAFRELLATPGAIRSICCRVASANGDWRHLDMVASNHRDDPVVAGIVVASWDVTELYRTQQTLEARACELQERVKEMACLTRVSEILWVPEGDWSSRLAEVVETIPAGFRWPDSTVARVDIEDRRHGSPGYREVGEVLAAPIEVDGERVGEVEVRLVDPPREGAEERPFLPEEGLLLRSIAQRLGEAVWRHRATDALRRSEAYFRTVAERAGVVIGVTNRDGKVLYVSEGVRGLLGTKAEAVVGSDLLDLVIPDDRPKVRALLEASIGEPSAVIEGRVWAATPNGEERHVEITIRNLLDEPAVEGLVVTARDITKRVQQEQQIQLQATLLDSVGQAVIATDPEGRVIYWNLAAAGIYGWSEEEVLGRSILEIVPTDETRSPSAAILDDLSRGERWSGELELRRRDGSVFPALVTNAPVLDRDGGIIGIIGVSTDLTERKALDEQLRQAQRLEAIGRLAGGVAHDFNNLLTVIGGHCSLAAGEVEPGSTVHHHLEQVSDAARRASQLTSQLLAFSRSQHVDEKVLDLQEQVRALGPVLRRLIPERISLDLEFGPEPCWTRADPAQLDQVVLNLAVNAKDAIETEGRITLQVGQEVLTERLAEELPWEARPGRYATLTVRDSGVGIPPSLVDRIFEPFFTTKPVGKGTGLGLSMVYGTVKRAGGHVLVESAPGRGATFRVLLPSHEHGPNVEPGNEVGERGVRVDASEGGGATVLLVEDDPSVRSLARLILGQQGFRVLVADNGREALTLLAQEGEQIDVVVSDVVMPDLGGGALARQLQGWYPEIRFVLMSGYPQEELPTDIREVAAAFLEKPFSPEDLARTVRRVLAGH